MLRARDKMDRSYDKPLDVAALARVALTSEAHFIRTFKETFGETPHRYLQRRRIERAMFLLRETDLSVSEICLEVGRSEEHTSELQSRQYLVCRLLLEKKNNILLRSILH